MIKLIQYLEMKKNIRKPTQLAFSLKRLLHIQQYPRSLVSFGDYHRSIDLAMNWPNRFCSAHQIIQTLAPYHVMQHPARTLIL